MKVITRFAPSPTGNLHIGSIRTALFNYLFTKKNDGQYLLRIDDTDKMRSKKEYEENILEGFKKVGLLWDNERLIRQSERTAIYKKYIEKLLAEDRAFISKEKDVAEGERAEVIRLRNPNKEVIFSDLIRGEVKFNTTELGDFVIAKSLEEPIYHFANVVDDFEMMITHVIRAEEHLSNTPRQILIQEAIGAPRPIYGHIPMILAPDRSKLSKRQGATALTDYIENGYLPEAILNYLAFLGWNPGGEQEIFSLSELVKIFDLEKVQKAGAIFSIEKLNWYNHQYISKSSDEDLTAHASIFVPEWMITSSDIFKRLLPTLREKIITLKDISTLLTADGELGFVHKTHDYRSDHLLWKKNPVAETAHSHLTQVRQLLEALSEDSFLTDFIKGAIWDYVEANGKGDVLWPLRMALTGQDRSPDPFTCAFILGKEESLKRIDNALQKLA